MDRYSTRRLTVLAPDWPGLEGTVEELRADPAPLTKLNLKAVVDHFDERIRAFDAPPIIMGHSFGGLIAQLLAYRGLGSAVVGIDAGAPAGVLELPFSTLKASAPVLANPLNAGNATMLTPEQFHYAFTNTLPEDRSRELYDRYAIPCANRILFEGAFENFVPHSVARVDVKADRAPVLLIVGGSDHLVTAKYHTCELRSHRKVAGRHSVQGISGSPALYRGRRRLGRGRGLCPRLGAEPYGRFFAVVSEPRKTELWRRIPARRSDGIVPT